MEMTFVGPDQDHSLLSAPHTEAGGKESDKNHSGLRSISSSLGTDMSSLPGPRTPAHFGKMRKAIERSIEPH